MKSITRLIAVTLLALFSTLALAAGVDINSADAATLADAIKGVGEKRAQAIVEYRETNGPFQSVDELTQVKGIGPRLLEQNRDSLVAGQTAQ